MDDDLHICFRREDSSGNNQVHAESLATTISVLFQNRANTNRLSGLFWNQREIDCLKIQFDCANGNRMWFLLVYYSKLNNSPNMDAVNDLIHNGVYMVTHDQPVYNSQSTNSVDYPWCMCSCWIFSIAVIQRLPITEVIPLMPLSPGLLWFWRNCYWALPLSAKSWSICCPKIWIENVDKLDHLWQSAVVNKYGTTSITFNPWPSMSLFKS